MIKKINPDMFRLAREFREITQTELSEKANISQSKITRLESGLYNDISSEEIYRLATTLQIDENFFSQNEDVLSYGSSAYFYRKKSKITASDSKRIHAIVNILRINIKQLLSNVDIKPKRVLPRLSLEEYGGSPVNVANALRGYWRLPEGPISNLTGIMESAGIIIISCDFGTRAMDATSLWVSELPPLVFINKDMPGDRWRFTLAHELGHLVMHDDAPYEAMEDEADIFASELLVPEIEIKDQFIKSGKLKLRDFAALKPYWKVSMGMLIRKALDQGFITDVQRRYFYMNLNKGGSRATEEPNPLPKEEPQNHKNLIGFYKNEMKYTENEFMKICNFSNSQDLELHQISFSDARPRLRKLRLV
jgi:Zn-dependent peptidase ImmA (M78 family)/transcriptional regulator with XRE-family HTH domain